MHAASLFGMAVAGILVMSHFTIPPPPSKGSKEVVEGETSHFVPHFTSTNFLLPALKGRARGWDGSLTYSRYIKKHFDGWQCFPIGAAVPCLYFEESPLRTLLVK